MSYKTRVRINKFANHLNAFADDLVACIEIVMSHLNKQPRRSRRTITRVPRRTRTRTRVVRQVVYRTVDARTGEVK